MKTDFAEEKHAFRFIGTGVRRAQLPEPRLSSSRDVAAPISVFARNMSGMNSSARSLNCLFVNELNIFFCTVLVTILHIFYDDIIEL